MNTVVIILLVASLLAVLSVLAVGIIGMVRGGTFNERNGNRLMRLRVVLQAVALLLFALFLFASSR